MLFDKLLKRKPKDAALPNAELPEGEPVGSPIPGDPMVGEEEAGWDDYGDEEEESGGSENLPDDTLSVMPDELPDELPAEADKQLEQMLEADRKADEGFNPQMNTGLVQKTAIFDGSLSDDESGSHPDLQWENYEKKRQRGAPMKHMDLGKPKGLRQRIMRMSVPKLLVSAFIIILVFLGMGYGAILIAQNVVAAEAEKEYISHFTPVTQPLDVTNDGNYIFINQTLSFNGTNFALSKISAGSLHTMVYFVNPPDLERYSFYMVDQSQNLYMRHETANYSEEVGTPTALEFDPLRIDTVFLTLTVHDNETGLEASFYFRFTEMPKFVAPKYFNIPTPVLEGEGEEEISSPIQIERVIAANTGTEVYYSISGDGGGGIRFSENTDAPFIQLKQGNRFIRPLQNSPVETRYGGQGTTVGKIVFDPLPFSDREIDLVFNDLFYTYSIQRRSVNMAALLDYENNEPQEILTGKQKLLLEAMGIQGNNIIMTLHGEDENGARIQTVVEGEISARTEDGDFTVTGECFSGDGGSDMVFTLDEEAYRALRGTPVANYTVTLNTVEYKIPQMELPVDLSLAEGAPESLTASAQSFLKESFDSRLAYKSHLANLSDVTGFSHEILSDRALMRYYLPSGMDEMPKYSARVVGGVMLPGNVYTGIVEEEWMLGTGEDLTSQHLTHRVVCEREGNRWTVTEDEIISTSADANLDTAADEDADTGTGDDV